MTSDHCIFMINLVYWMINIGNLTPQDGATP